MHTGYKVCHDMPEYVVHASAYVYAQAQEASVMHDSIRLHRLIQC